MCAANRPRMQGAPRRISSIIISPLCSAPFYSQLSSLISFGQGAPLPVSRNDFRLSRNTPHFVLQWCMNSTGSFQPWCLKTTMVQSPSCLRSKPPAPKRNCSTPPTLLSPCVSVVHQAERPSRIVNALYVSSSDDDLIPTLCRI